MQDADKKMLKFLGVFFLVFFLTATALYIIDFVPEAPEETSEENTTALVDTSDVDGHMPGQMPVAIRIPKIGVDTSIENPNDTSLDVLDNALLNGAVRYPGSATLGEDSTMFLFGHQSYLPVVRNEAFKAFNGLQELTPGDTISVYSSDAEYQYAVRSVTKVRADEALIPIVEGEKTLVLSTCNSFGDPGERFVVEADYVGKVAI